MTFIIKRKKIKVLKYTQMNKFVISALLLMLTHLGVVAQGNQGTVLDKIIAKVDNYIVLKSDLDKAYLQFLSSGQLSSGNTKCQILESLIINKMLVAKAEIDSVVVSDIEVDAILQRKMQYFIAQIGSEERIEEFYGKTIEQFKEELREQEKEQEIIRRMQAHITTDIEVTPAEVRKFFKNIPRDSLPYFSKEVAIAQIVKLPEVSKSEKEKAKRKLVELRTRILEGEDFNVLAREFSDEPAAASSGGELGWFKRGELAPGYEATALRLKPGELSMPVETQFGIHLIELIERRGNQYNSRHILVRPSSSGRDVEVAEEYLDSLRTLVINDSISFEKAAKEYSDDQFTSANGGFFQDQTGASRISVEELDPVVFFAIDTMKAGNISEPIVYRMDDGKEAVRILYFKSSVKPHQANLIDDWQKISNAALTEKKNKEIAKWFKGARKEVFINIDDEHNSCNILQ